VIDSYPFIPREGAGERDLLLLATRQPQMCPLVGGLTAGSFR